MDRYINQIKNPVKMAYAKAYAAFLRGETAEPASPSRAHLSVMAAQAVRMRLSDFTE
jgi:hypothetical protein